MAEKKVNWFGQSLKVMRTRITPKTNYPKTNKPVTTPFGIYRTNVLSPRKYSNLNWKQAKKKFPSISPYDDADMDGTPNYKDCKPFDASRDGVFSALAAIVSGKKHEANPYRKRLDLARASYAKKGGAGGVISRNLAALQKSMMSKQAGMMKRLDPAKKKVKEGRTLARPPSMAARRFAAGVSGTKPTTAPYEKKEGGVNKGYSRPGRPRGTFKYFIPGVGSVDVFTWRKYARKMAALQRLKGELPQQAQAQAQPYAYYSSAAAERSGQQIPLQQQRLTPQEQYAQTLSKISLSEQEGTPVSAQQPQQMQQQMPSQPSGNILTPSGHNILQAPNFMKGELRNVGQNSPVQNPDQMEHPVTNRDGDYYTVIDPMSGKQVVQRRVREKWSGEFTPILQEGDQYI